jgi:uncharacterized phage protein (TIGR01671 family)
MREIKFRAWDKEYEHMCYQNGSYWCLGFWDLRKPIHITIFDSDGNDRCIENFVLMQYTGFHDKFGKEIYEGDIVRVRSENHAGLMCQDGKVKWDNVLGGYYVDGKEYKNLSHKFTELLGFCNTSHYSKHTPPEPPLKMTCEVIGNIVEKR